MSANFQQLANFIWSVADLLRGPYRPPQYERVMLPLIDGFELCSRIRTMPALAATRIMLLTARGRESEIARGIALGADAYLTKPFSTRELMDKVRALLASPRRPGT